MRKKTSSHAKATSLRKRRKLQPKIKLCFHDVSKVFECVNCGLEADRDIHAARNILLRYVPDLFVLPEALESGA